MRFSAQVSPYVGVISIRDIRHTRRCRFRGAGADSADIRMPLQSKPPPPVEARFSATMTDHGCTYEGNTSLARAPFTIDVRNGSASDGGFQFSMMAPGATRNDVDAWLKKLNRQLPAIRWLHHAST